MDSTCWIEAEGSGVHVRGNLNEISHVCWGAFSCTKRPRNRKVERTSLLALLLMHLHHTTWVRIGDVRALRHRTSPHAFSIESCGWTLNSRSKCLEICKHELGETAAAAEKCFAGSRNSSPAPHRELDAMQPSHRSRIPRALL